MIKILSTVLLLVLILLLPLSSAEKAEIAEEPAEASKITSFSTAKPNTLAFNISKGDGEYRLVAIMKEKEPGEPIDTFYYKPDERCGIGDSLPGGGYVTHLSEYENYFEITNLEPGTEYFIKIFDANGWGSNANYLTEGVKAYSHTTIPEIPYIEEIQYTENYIKIEWNDAKGAERYSFQAAYDESFKNFIEGFKNIIVFSSSADIPYSSLKNTGGNIYVRVKSTGKTGESAFSVPNKVETDND